MSPTILDDDPGRAAFLRAWHLAVALTLSTTGLLALRQNLRDGQQARFGLEPDALPAIDRELQRRGHAV